MIKIMWTTTLPSTACLIQRDLVNLKAPVILVRFYKSKITFTFDCIFERASMQSFILLMRILTTDYYASRQNMGVIFEMEDEELKSHKAQVKSRRKE